MAVPTRNADAGSVLQPRRTFFVTTKTWSGRRIFQVDRNAELFVDVLRSCARRFLIHDFVLMPDHVHLLLTVEDLSIEKAMQFLKGGFSFRMKKELGYAGEVWQRGFSEVRVNDETSLQRHREYIAQNPVKAGLVESAELYRWTYEALRKRKSTGAKARHYRGLSARLKPCPDTKPAGELSVLSHICGRAEGSAVLLRHPLPPIPGTPPADSAAERDLGFALYQSTTSQLAEKL